MWKNSTAEPTGNFQHNPEPLEKNLGDIMELMKGGKADVAFVVVRMWTVWP